MVLVDVFEDSTVVGNDHEFTEIVDDGFTRIPCCVFFVAEHFSQYFVL